MMNPRTRSRRDLRLLPGTALWLLTVLAAALPADAQPAPPPPAPQRPAIGAFFGYAVNDDMSSGDASSDLATSFDLPVRGPIWVRVEAGRVQWAFDRPLVASPSNPSTPQPMPGRIGVEQRRVTAGTILTLVPTGPNRVGIFTGAGVGIYRYLSDEVEIAHPSTIGGYLSAGLEYRVSGHLALTGEWQLHKTRSPSDRSLPSFDGFDAGRAMNMRVGFRVLM